MAGMLKFFAVVSLCSVITGIVVANDLAASFAEAAARGDAQQNASSTSEYFSKVLMPYFGQK